MEENLEGSLCSDLARARKGLPDFTEYNLNNSLSLNQISTIVSKCEQLFYENFRDVDYRQSFA